jgi:hypothetical protein
VAENLWEVKLEIKWSHRHRGNVGVSKGLILSSVSARLVSMSKYNGDLYTEGDRMGWWLVTPNYGAERVQYSGLYMHCLC